MCNPDRKAKFVACAEGCDISIHRNALGIAILALVWGGIATVIALSYFGAIIVKLEANDTLLWLHIEAFVILIAFVVLCAGLLVHYFLVFFAPERTAQFSPLIPTQRASDVREEFNPAAALSEMASTTTTPSATSRPAPDVSGYETVSV